MHDDADIVAREINLGRGARSALSECSEDGHERWEQAAAAGDPSGSWLLGLALEFGVNVDPDRQRAVELYEQSVEGGYAPAMYQLARALQNFSKDDEEAQKRAVTLYAKAAQNGFAAAMCNYAVALLEGKGTDYDPEKGLEWLTRAAEADNTVAQVNLGACYADGDFVERSPKTAVRWYKRAAELGHRGALCLLGMCYEDGLGVQRDLTQAAQLYEKAALAGDVEAQLLLGFCFEEGNGVKADPAKAVYWYRKGAEAGDSHAQVALASCYKRGDGVDQDPREAVRWFRAAAIQGDSEAQYQLGLCLSRGQGAESDHAEALTWYRLAAEQDHPDAHYCIGVAYSRGDGVERDLETAYTWFDRAAALGSEVALQAISGPQIGAGDPCAIVADLLDAVQRPGGSFEEAKAVACVVMQSAAGEDTLTLNAMMRCLAPGLLSPDPDRAGVAALVCGALVENGGAPNLSLGFITDRLPEVMEGATRFLELCRQRARWALPDDATEAEVAELMRDEALIADVAIEHIDESRCWHALDFWCQPAIAMLSRDAEARRRLNKDALLEGAELLKGAHKGVHYLWQLVQTVTDREFLVIHPALHRGYKLRVSGVSDNFQLHSLMGDALIDNNDRSLLPGRPPARSTVEVCTGEGPQRLDETTWAHWDLYSWRALRCDLSLPVGSDGREYRISNEDVPASLEEFEGTPALLLDQPRVEQSWNVCRTFASLPARVTVEKVLERHEVDGILQRMAANADRLRP